MSVERIEPGTREWEECYGGHLFRYHFASQQLHTLQPRRILDVACGVGYGSRYLAEQTSAEIIGVDRNQQALAQARSRFAHPSIEFRLGDCEKLEDSISAGERFDAIVSLETLEHVPDAASFLSGLRAHIAAGGILVLSTPNLSVRRSNEPIGKFHSREYTASELMDQLQKAGFASIGLSGQKLTAPGMLRAEMREALLQITLNPAVRLGRILQRLRGHRFPLVPLPEQLSDFEVVSFESASDCERLGSAGPEVLLAIAKAS